jgi:transcription antitermination factor NusG
VIGPVMLGVLPNEVPEKIIKEWKSREDKHGLLLPIIHQFRPGQSVKVTHGPLKGQVGSYDQYVRADHHQIILEILGQSVKTDLSETMFEAA